MEAARGILNDAEAELKDWSPSWEAHGAEAAALDHHQLAAAEKHHQGEGPAAGSHLADAGASSVTGEHTPVQYTQQHHDGVAGVEARVREEERQPVAA
jgi:hypothetical protein